MPITVAGFHAVCRKGDLTELENILLKDPQLANLSEKELADSLNILVDNNHDKLINFCLMADNTRIKSFFTQGIIPGLTRERDSSVGGYILMRAVEKRWSKTAELLVKNGFDIHQYDPCGTTGLRIAIENKLVDILAIFLQYGQWTQEQKDKTLQHISIYGDFTTAKALISKGANVNAINENKNALNLAMQQLTLNYDAKQKTLDTDHLKLITLLLKSKANFDPAVNPGDNEDLHRFVFRLMQEFKKFAHDENAVMQFKQDFRKCVKEMILTANVNMGIQLQYPQFNFTLLQLATKFDPELAGELQRWQNNRDYYNHARSMKKRCMFFATHLEQRISKEKQNLPEQAASTTISTIQFN